MRDTKKDIQGYADREKKGAKRLLMEMRILLAAADLIVELPYGLGDPEFTIVNIAKRVGRVSRQQAEEFLRVIKPFGEP